MEHPVREIPEVITNLTTGSPEVQSHTLQTYFTSDASFTHPFCRVPSLRKGTIPLLHWVDSRWLILGIYRWYRTLSPSISINIDSAVFDQKTGLLYVTINQTFALWFVPFYKAPVRLVSVLRLTQRQQPPPPSNAHAAAIDHDKGKYYIASQEDLYQVNDFINFLMPGFGPALWWLWQVFSALLCVVGSLVFLPLYFVMN
ncbi:uncharacterized protein F5Z01DRAFT_642381 [Emericellopsis atlantica]|uniref:SigF-like NTF2-like domain-containing protein n=1 Tax=Emericellopsis atlantica TaxID=2614577 RepID=A0A9P8CTG0_9HYPO|nr:uncharacterized protein F5Z01DRAFT_642381 [Emericellopsis atlantica]KAG9259124.1 hypothetical protein F5Z01DRAFT_642381 [Emericellopsis atlantica]